jgi:hypothetical protein
MPTWNDPLVLAPGQVYPLPPGGFHDWDARHRWEAQVRARFRMGQITPAALVPPPPPQGYRQAYKAAVVAATGMTPHQMTAVQSSLDALSASIGLGPTGWKKSILAASGVPPLQAPFLLPDGTSYPLPASGFPDLDHRHQWEQARLGEFHAGHIHGTPPSDPSHPFHATIAPQTTPNYVTPVRNPNTGASVPPHGFTLHGPRPQTNPPVSYVADLSTGAMVPTPAAPTAIRNVTPPSAPTPPTAVRPVVIPAPPPHIISIPKQVVVSGGTTTLVDPGTGVATHTVDPSTGVAHPVTPASNTVTGSASSHPVTGSAAISGGSGAHSGGGSGTHSGSGGGGGHGGGKQPPAPAGDFGYERRWMPGGGMSDRALGMAGIPTPGQFMGQVVQFDRTMDYDAAQADADAAAGITPPPMTNPDGTPIVQAPFIPDHGWGAGRGWSEGAPPAPLPPTAIGRPDLYRRGMFHGDSFGHGHHHPHPGSGGMSQRALGYAGIGVPGQFMQDEAAYAGTMASDAYQATADAAAGITPPPMVGPDGTALVAPPAWRPDWRRRRFHGEFGADAPKPTSQKASDLQLAGAAIGVGAAGMKSKDRDGAEKVAASHVHSLAGLVLTGAGNVLHKMEAWWHTLVHPSKTVTLPDGSKVTTLAPIEIKGQPSTAPAPGNDTREGGFGWDVGERFHRQERLGPQPQQLPPYVQRPDPRRHDPRFHDGRRDRGQAYGGAVAAAQAAAGVGVTSTLASGASLGPGSQISSPSRNTSVGVAMNGNLLLPGVSGVTGVATLTMQPDGNLVATGSDGSIKWASGTNTRAFSSYMAGQTLKVQDDGNVVMLSPDGTRIMWASNTYAGGSGVPGPGQGV